MPDQGLEESVLSRIAGMTDELIDGVAGKLGLPPGGKRYTMAEQIAEWTYSPYADPQSRMDKALELHLQGATPEKITDELYPNLRRLVTTGRTRPDEQIAFARQMRKQVGWPDEVPTVEGLLMNTPTAQPAPSPLTEPAPVEVPTAPVMPAPPPMTAPPPPAPAGVPRTLPVFDAMLGG